MSVPKKRVAVLASGSGTNLQALIDATAAANFPATIVLVGSNVSSAKALEKAKAAGIPTEILEHTVFSNKTAFEQAWLETLRRYDVELVCLAGFMRLLGPTFLSEFGGRTLNIHPSLLPAFPGLHGPRQALEHGVKIAGCTVHLVDAGTDTGPILGQAAVPVLDNDDESTLAARILKEEHRLYPFILKQWALGRIQLRGRSSLCSTQDEAAPSSLHQPREQ